MKPSTDKAQACPTKQFFVSMLTRDISLDDAILDLVDNCLDGALRLANGNDVDYAKRVLRVTLNANPTFLGKPDPKDLSVEVEGEASKDRASKPTIQEWRLARFKERLGALFPSGLTAEGMTFKTYGPSLLRALKLAVDNEGLSFRDRRIVWTLAMHYADGQAMVTAALVVAPKDDTGIEEVVKGWEFYTTTDAPHRLDLPALSTLERLTMESNDDARPRLGFEIPTSDMGTDPFEVFKKFYRIYPHFSRVEL